MDQKVFFENKVDNHVLRKVLSENTNIKTILLVTGKQSYINCGADNYITNSINKDITLIRFFNFSPNPCVKDLKKGLQLFRKNKFDAIIACGGGSVIDIAKCIAFFANYHSTVEDYLSGKRNNNLNNIIPIIALPTTAGTGSEATHFAVLYWNKKKYSVASPLLLPKAAVINSSFTECMSSYQTACTGMDAFCQALEAYWSINSTKESRKYSAEAIKIIVKNIQSAVNNPNSRNRFMMATAAYNAGKAINIAKTTAAHAISYSFTSYYNIPHGHAVALTISDFFNYNSKITKSECNDFRGHIFVKKRLGEIVELLGCKSYSEASSFIQKFILSIGLQISYKKLGITEKNISDIVRKVNMERLQNNPRKISDEKLAQILLSHCK